MDITYKSKTFIVFLSVELILTLFQYVILLLGLKKRDAACCTGRVR